MYREDPWTHRYSTWKKGEWEDATNETLYEWMQYFQHSKAWRLHRVSGSWMIWRYVGGIFPEDVFHIFFHHREV